MYVEICIFKSKDQTMWRRQSFWRLAAPEEKYHCRNYKVMNEQNCVDIFFPPIKLQSL